MLMAADRACVGSLGSVGVSGGYQHAVRSTRRPPTGDTGMWHRTRRALFPQPGSRICRARFRSLPRVAIVVPAALLSVFGSMGLAVSVAAPAVPGNWAPVSPGDFP